jgi:hypothetical protein
MHATAIHRRSAALVVAALVASFALTVVRDRPADAAGCYGNTCTGRDPIAMGCSGDARTIDRFSAGFRVELRYSARCDAAWVKAIGTTSSRYRGAIHGFSSRSAPYPYVVYGTGTPTRDGTYSLMVSFRSWVAACQEYNASGWSTQGCTARH